MEVRFWILIGAILAVLGIGIAGGFYLELYFQNQIPILFGAAAILAIVTWLGTGTDILGLLRELHKDNRERDRLEKLAPKLSIRFDIQSNPDDFVPTGFLHGKTDGSVVERKAIRLQIQNDGGSVAEKCKATISEINRLDGCECPARTTKQLSWLSGQMEQDIRPHGDREMLEFVFADSDYTDWAPTKAKCVVQNTNEALIIAWAATASNLRAVRQNGDGFCSGGFELMVSVFPTNSEKITKKVSLKVGKTWSDMHLTLL